MPGEGNGGLGWKYNSAKSLTRDQSKGKPCTKSNRSYTANSADEEDMSERFCDLNEFAVRMSLSGSDLSHESGLGSL